MTPESVHAGDGLSVLVVGNDTLIEMLPARPIQVARACGRAGFDLVVPLSWGDELVAGAVLEVLAERPAAPAVLCTCPLVRRRLLHAGPELKPSMLSVAAPPVAVSRHLRAILGARLRSLAFAGRCPSARLPDYDLTLDPRDLRDVFEAGRISPDDEPDFFEDVIPPDRRRFLSLPGGCPTPEHLWQRCNERVPVDLEGRDVALDLAQALLSSQPILVDIALAVGCSCAGVTAATSGRLARIAVASLEPPRSPTSVIEPAEGIQFRLDPTGAEPRRSSLLDRETHRQTHRELPSEEEPSKTARPPLAVTPTSALRIGPRPKRFGE
jgi:hypothetical protein